MTPNDMFLQIMVRAAPAFASKGDNNLVGAQQNAEALAKACVQRCFELGLFNGQPAVAAPPPAPQQIAPQAAPAPVASFPQDTPIAAPQVVAAPVVAVPAAAPLTTEQQLAATAAANAQAVPFPQATAAPQIQGVGAPQAQVATGAGQPAAPPQPYTVAGTQIVPPAGGSFQPPAQAGVQNIVTQVPTPQGHSALGGGGVVSQPVQKPIGHETVVAPASQLVVQQPQGSGLPQVVAERIVR
jgi:hypothetical protein